jgi:hypothetical protein
LFKKPKKQHAALHEMQVGTFSTLVERFQYQINIQSMRRISKSFKHNIERNSGGFLHELLMQELAKLTSETTD